MNILMYSHDSYGLGHIRRTMALARSILALWADLTVTRVSPFRWPEAGDAVAWEVGQGIVEGWLEDGRLRVRTAEGVLDLTGGDLRGLSPLSMPS